MGELIGKSYKKGDIIDICIKDYLNLPEYLKDCLKGYKVGLDFVEKKTIIDPYILGYYLGNINTGKHIFRVTTIYKELVNYFRDYAIFNTKDLQIKKNITNANPSLCPQIFLRQRLENPNLSISITNYVSPSAQILTIK